MLANPLTSHNNEYYHLVVRYVTFLTTHCYSTSMKILLVTALFPPDVTEPAPYLKELATRLSAGNEVVVLTYGSKPEQVEGVRFNVVKKSLIVPLRLIQFTWNLFIEGRHSYIILVNNAPSTEAPLIACSPLLRKKLYLSLSDKKIIYTSWRKTINQIASRRVKRAVDLPSPLPKPEIHPFKSVTEGETNEYESSWQDHLDSLLTKLKA